MKNTKGRGKQEQRPQEEKLLSLEEQEETGVKREEESGMSDEWYVRPEPSQIMLEIYRPW